MATPLYKKMKQKGTSFYAFPSAIKDFSLSSFQDNIKISPSKFILLNIPKSVEGTSLKPGILDFIKTTDPNSFGTKFYSWDPNGPRSDYKYSDTLVEGLRNYVSNYDTVFRESRITEKKDFYNPAENKTPTEMIFWKWLKKLNVLDFEPAIHKIDWDKNLSDFENPNASSYTNRDHFRKYLWKERDINEYDCSLTQASGNVPQISINEIAKFKKGDNIFICGSGYTGNELFTGVSYSIDDIQFSNTDTIITLTESGYDDSNVYNCQIKLDYHKVVQYIGEVQAVSKIQTSEHNYTEFTAMIPPHVGQSPSVLFETIQHTNYYPGLELPILPDEIQPEINGAEYLNSPIRTNPSDFPGSYFGYYDTIDKTYIKSNGDAIRYKGDYYGILKTYNDNLNEEDYIERLDIFNSDNIDGLTIDFNRKHYLKMNIPGSTVKNFDEFNAMVINDEPPKDFEFNAILWYYDIDDGSGEINTNLYGIELLNNPDDDFGLTDDKVMTTTRKLATNKNQDGLSYIYNLNLEFKVDNSVTPLKYDTSSIYNLFGFDLYNNVMANYGKLNRNFMTIIDSFVEMNKKMIDLESIIYTQTDLDEIKHRLNEQDELLKLYQTNQFVNSDTVSIDIDYTKNYPAMKLNTKTADYDDIQTLYTDDIIQHNIEYSDNTGSFSSTKIIGDVKSGSGWLIEVSQKGKILVNINNNIVTDYSEIDTLGILIDKDLTFKQSIDFIIKPDLCDKLKKIQFNIMYDDGTGKGTRESVLFKSIGLPIDLDTYNVNDPIDSTYNNSYYSDVSTYITGLTTGTTTDIVISDDVFETNDWVYINNFLFDNTDGTVIDYSGVYKILTKNGTQITLEWDTRNSGISLKGKPKVFYYHGVKINILRTDNSRLSDISHRYLISKEFLSSEYGHQ